MGGDTPEREREKMNKWEPMNMKLEIIREEINVIPKIAKGLRKCQLRRAIWVSEKHIRVECSRTSRNGNEIVALSC